MIRTFYDVGVTFSYPYNGSYKDQELGHRYLERGKTYLAERIVESDWYTYVYLKDYPEVIFNSSIFDIHMRRD